ncbi:MAG: Esterase/lipase [Phycisphaerales bacterium]|nr:Esterase/lipase [Phycisphaerales bacterium]
MPFLSRALVALWSTSAVAYAAPAVTDKADPDMKAVLDQLAGLQPKPITSLPPAKARAQPSAADAVVQLMQVKGMIAPEKLPAVGRVETKAIQGPDNAPLPLRVYTPEGDGPFPVVVYFHGGGWVIADVDTYDSSCRAICSMAKAVVVAVECRGHIGRITSAHSCWKRTRGPEQPVVSLVQHTAPEPPPTPLCHSSLTSAPSALEPQQP